MLRQAAVGFSTAVRGQLRAASVLSLINVAVQLCTVMLTVYSISVKADTTVCELLVVRTSVVGT